jgi:hypothetical protein
MPRRDLTLAEKIGFLDQIKQQPPKTSQRRLVEITGLAKNTILSLIKQEPPEINKLLIQTFHSKCLRSRNQNLIYLVWFYKLSVGGITNLFKFHGGLPFAAIIESIVTGELLHTFINRFSFVQQHHGRS